jgi:uncharacterized RDD family membrane protein YckC/predicted Ser/Thr protein kinase
MGEPKRGSPGIEATLPRVNLSPPKREMVEVDPLIGTSLRHFRVEKVLGRGGMGSVYLGWDTSLERSVALKVLSPELAYDAEIVARFAREARTQAKVRHPNVTQIYFIGEDRGLHFFAMEYIDGSALDRLIESGDKLPWARALEYVLMTARGLRAAHNQGFIHRDVKPSNLLLEKDDVIKIADFGLVKSTSGDGELTQKGVIVGSPQYMAPEQGRAENVDHRSDIYSLGCTFYHLITKQPPFDAPSPVAIMSMHVTDRATRIRALCPEVPENVERVVDRMMSKDPGSRFSSYDELLATLEKLRPGQREYTGFWSRGAALGIDAAVLAPFFFAIGLWSLLLWPPYFIVTHRMFGQTLGKRLLHLQVTDLAGARPSWKAAGLRFAAFGWAPLVWGVFAVVLYYIYRDDLISFQLSRLTLRHLGRPLAYIAVSTFLLLGYLSGFLLAAFHPRRQALHDLLVRTEVTYAPSGGLKRYKSTNLNSSVR